MAKKKISFEASLARLEEIVKLLECGDLPLSDSLKLFEEGTSVIASLNSELEQAEQEVYLLKKNDNGTPNTDITYEE